jgi:hypothetical protein
MLSFHVESQFNSLQVDLDAKGMAVLMGALAKLVGERASHVHLCAPGAGGTDLDATTSSGDKAFLEVIINYYEGD